MATLGSMYVKMVTIRGNELDKPGSNPAFVPHHTNDLKKGMNSSLPPCYGQNAQQTDSLALLQKPV